MLAPDTGPPFEVDVEGNHILGRNNTCTLATTPESKGAACGAGVATRGKVKPGA